MLTKSTNPNKTYIEEILPIKQQYYIQYVNEQSLLLDIKLIVRTIVAIVQ